MAASSLSFHQLLNKLKVPDECKPSQDADLEWMWADAHCACLLDWLAENVDGSNTVTAVERQQYELLCEQGVALSGKYLDEALTSVDVLEELSEEVLDKKLKEMEEESERLAKRQTRLRQISAELSRRVSQTKMNASRTSNAIGQLQRDLRGKLQLCEKEHETVQEVLRDLRDTVEKLHLVYAGSETTQLTCHFDLQPFYESEKSYTSALAQFTDRRFFNGLSRVAADSNEKSYQLLNMTNPDLTVKQEKPESITDGVSELKRLQQLHSRSLQLNIDMQIEYAKCEAAQDTLLRSNSTVAELCRLGADQLHNHLDRVKGKLALHNRELSSARDRDLTSLIEQTTLLKETHILTGDYNLKIARQQYFLGCQQQVITNTVEQRARNELLTLILEVEMDDVQKTRHVLVSITAYLQQLVSASTQQLQLLEDADMSSKRYDRTVVDPRDVLLDTVDKMLEERDGKKGRIFTSYKELVTSASQFLSLHREKTSTCQPPTRAIHRMREASDACRELVLEGGEDSPFTPKDITCKMSELRLELKLLESNIKTIMSTISLKRKLLKE